MNIELIRKYCLKKPRVTESLPFDENTLVFKVVSKIFLLTSIDKIPLRINIKCDPEKAIEQRERYTSVTPGYHMNKKYWNTVIIDGSIPRQEIFKWIDDSYFLTVGGLKKSDRDRILGLLND